jgi:hypothetical protein
MSKTKKTKALSKKTAAKGKTKKVGGETKKSIVTGLLQRAAGATLAEVMKATGWLAHSCRGAISTLKAKSVVADGVRRYKL